MEICMPLTYDFDQGRPLKPNQWDPGRIYVLSRVTYAHNLALRLSRDCLSPDKTYIHDHLYGWLGKSLN